MSYFMNVIPTVKASCVEPVKKIVNNPNFWGKKEEKQLLTRV